MSGSNSRYNNAVTEVQRRLVNAGLARRGQSPSKIDFVQSDFVTIGQAGDQAIVYLNTHAGVNGPARRSADIADLRRRLNLLLAGVPNVTISANKMGPARAFANA